MDKDVCLVYLDLAEAVDKGDHQVLMKKIFVAIGGRLRANKPPVLKEHTRKSRM